MTFPNDEEVHEYLKASAFFNTEVASLFGEASLRPLSRQILDFLKKNLLHVRIEIDHALMVLAERRIAIEGSTVTNAKTNANHLRSNARRPKLGKARK